MDKLRKDDLPYAVNINTSLQFDEDLHGSRPSTEDSMFKRSKFVRFFHYAYDAPAKFLYEKIAQLRGKERAYYYHKKFNRVPTVDECYTDDLVCIWEANQQLKRDLMVDKTIKTLLQDRFKHCMYYHGYDDAMLCEKLREDLNKSLYNFELKYGETGGSKLRAQDVYMKQKHRLIMERRKKLKDQAGEKE